MWGLCFCAALAFVKALFCGVCVVVGLWVLWRRLCFAASLFLWGSGFSDGGIWCVSKDESITPTPVAMENEHHRENVVHDEEDGHHEEENVEAVDDPVVRNGSQDVSREHGIRLNAIGFEAEVVALPDPIAINLGTATDPIEVGDLPVHGFEFQLILLTCPPLQPLQEEEEG